MSRSYKFAQSVLIGAALLPVWFMIAALGTKFGLWGWQTGLGTLTVKIGPILLAVVALLGLVALVWCVAKPPRNGWWMAVAALILPLAAFAAMAGMKDRASANPVHDVATDAINPPAFPDRVVQLRAEQDLNPILDYGTILSDVGPWGENAFPEIANETHRSLVPRLYPDLRPLVVDASVEDALLAAQAAMVGNGLTNVTSNLQNNTVSGVAETFWFGFKDDVVARIRSSEQGTVIDFRSVSRVGLSDLGTNAERLQNLRAATLDRVTS